MSTWGGYDGTIIATRFQKTFIKDYLDLSGRLDVRNYDVSLNNRLFVMNDASFMGNMYINGNLTANIFVSNGDVSLNNRLFVINDASFTSNVYVDDILNVNLNFISNGDASLNSNVLAAKDISCNGNLSIGRNITINGNLAIKNYTSQNIINTTTTNYQFVVSEDLSLNGRLAVSNDASMNGTLFVSRDISLNGNIRINSFLKNITVSFQNIGIGNSVYDTIFGYGTFSAVPSGSIAEKNTAIGFQSFLYFQTGSHNTGFGMGSLYSTVNGNCNTAVGNYALLNFTSSNNNTAVGSTAGSRRTTGSSNTYIGTDADAAGNNYSNSTAIGYLSSITRSNEIVLGTSSELVTISRIERHLAPPIIIRKATTSQSIGGGTTVLFPTSVYDNGFTGLGYNSATGVFTNNNSYSICLNISVSVNLPANTSGLRALYITTGPNAADRYAIVMDKGINNTYSQHLTTLLPLGSGGWFSADLWQNTGSNINITTDTTFTYPTIITIHVF
uniref:Uncharacterized protein n=1 Tax=viral metagenome TaxID=1070528 RepID=A0A6C0KKN5_9ZZZZ